MSRVTTAESALKEANALFVDENYEDALKYYSEAIELDDSNAETFLKRSACYYKLDKFTDSVSDANTSIKLQPANSKAYLRKGMALFALDEFETAKAAFEKGQQLDSSNTTLRTWIRKCDAELENETSSSTSTTITSEPPKSAIEKPQTNNNTTSNLTPTPQSQVKAPIPDNKPRYEWYQTATHVFVSVFVKNVKKEQANIEFEDQSICVTIKLGESNEFQLDIELFDKIVPAECSASFLSTKIELKLKKATPNPRWKTLENTGDVNRNIQQIDTSSSSTSAAPKKKNWDKIVEEVAKTDPLDSEESLNKVFQDIYSNGSEEQRRAMMKSFLESGGTVLSTNWDEVGKKEVKGSPPDGLEMHKWEELNK